MSESLSRAISIGSIVLTVVSLTLAVVFVRRKTRIRIGLDLARAFVSITAILVMAAVTQIATSTLAIVLAATGGLALGFGQGSNLEVTRDQKGFHARRNPAAIALWGVGIVVMQAAGLASRAGVVRLGQTIAWFSACLGIGLMVGRGGPIRRAATSVGVTGLLAAVVLPAAFVAGIETGAAAQSELTAEDLCAFAPYQTLVLDAGDGMQQDELSALGPATADGVKFCARAFGGYIEDGLRYNANIVSVYLYPSTADATTAFNETAAAFEVTMPDVGIGDQYMEIGVLGDLDFLAMGQRGPFVFQLYSWFEYVPAREAMREIDNNVAPYVTDTDLVPSTSVAPGGGETTTTVDSQSVTGTTTATTIAAGSEPATSEDEPIEPEEAARQAIAGLIAAVAIGLITWGEAAAEIANILSGLPETGGGFETIPTGFIDPYDNTPLEADPATGMVWWPWDGGEGQWVDPSQVPGLLSDWNRELDAETARRVAIHDAQREQNWADLHDRIARSNAEDAARQAWEKARLDAFDRYTDGAEGWMEQADANSLGVLDRIRQRVADQGFATDADIAEARRIANDSRTYWDTMQRMGEEDWVRIHNNHATIVEVTAKTAASIVNPIAAGAIFGGAESIYDGKSAMDTLGNTALGAGLGWAGGQVGAWAPGKAALGNIGWGATSGAAWSATETLIRGGSWEDAWNAAKTGFVAGGGSGIVESVTTTGGPPPADLPTIRSRPGGPRVGYDTPFNPRLRPPERGGVGAMTERVPTIQVRPGGPRPHYDQPMSPRHNDPSDPRYVPAGTPADQVHTPPSDWSQPPPKIIETEGPLGGRPPSQLPRVAPTDVFEGQPPAPRGPEPPSTPPLPGRPPVDLPEGPIPGSKSDWSQPPPKIVETDGPLGGRPPSEPPPVSPADVAEGRIPGSKSDWSQPPPKIIEAEGPLGGRLPSEPPPVSPADAFGEPPASPPPEAPSPPPPSGRLPVDVPEGPIPGSKSDWSGDPTEYMPVDESPGLGPLPEPPPVSPVDATGRPPLGDLPERTPPTRDQLLGQARPTMDGSELVDKAMEQPRHPVPADAAPQPSTASPGAMGNIDIDAEGRFVVGGRELGSVDPDTGMLTNGQGERVLIAMDDQSGMPVGYIEQPAAPTGMSPTYNSRGELAGYVDPSGRAVIDGELTPVAIDADGNLVPYKPPPAPAAATPEDVVGQARIRDDAAPVTGAGEGAPRTEVEPVTGTGGGPPTGAGTGGAIEILSTAEVDINPRIPVLDADGSPAHYVEPGPREIHFDPDGNPLYAQRTFPAEPLVQRGGGISAPVQEVYDSSIAYHPLTGENAPPPAPLVGGSDTKGGGEQ